MENNEDWRDKVVKVAYTWLRTPYHHHARIRGVGVDCATLLLEVYQEVGVIEPIDPGYYSPQWNLNQHKELYLEWIRKYCKPIPYGTPKPGDIAMFRFGHTLSHSSIVIDWPLAIHATNGLGVTLVDVEKQTADKTTLIKLFRGAFTKK